MKTVIKVENVITRFASRTIHDGVSLHINENDIYAVLGESGSGKSVLIKEMIMLLSPTKGKISVLGKSLKNISFEDAQALRSDWGVLFQFGALYSSLTIAENIAVQLKEFTNISKIMREKLVQSKLELVGLEPHVGSMYPSELSGGMVKRAALARALVMEPKLLFLDEPTSGLDPIGARNFDDLIVELRDLLGITVVMITHDLESIFSIVDRLAILADKHVVAQGTLENVLQSTHPFVEAFFKNDYTRERFKDKVQISRIEDV
ncbi:MAG: ABC transporter ATP-binding protein [Epsilonproteobacteria bacterium]|nr:MAG: ABC transporter ATP-binding protein [Campylobacterota bacterium]